MGWSGGTDIFDTVVESLIDADVSDNVFKNVIRDLVSVLEAYDWDAQGESEYLDLPIMKDIFTDLFDGDDEYDDDEANEQADDNTDSAMGNMKRIIEVCYSENSKATIYGTVRHEGVYFHDVPDDEVKEFIEFEVDKARDDSAYRTVYEERDGVHYIEFHDLETNDLNCYVTFSVTDILNIIDGGK